MTAEQESIALIVQGRVQGVGFRPFVWRLANELGICGSVRNTSAGVRIEACGSKTALEELEKRLVAEQPPLADITSLKREAMETLTCMDGFHIGHSQGHSGQNVLVSPDIGICADCLADIGDMKNRRYGYAFTNCVNCGPRYSITKTIPYDRPGTVMACFPLCPSCAAEYSNPADRRFHAQPIACPDCGPTLWFVDSGDIAADSTNLNAKTRANALERAGRLLLDGGILALKGLGGFQLACNARDDKAVSRLRKRKNRPHKALAVMARNMDAIGDFCSLLPAHEKLLESAEKPVVLCPKSRICSLSPLIAPDCPHIGIMLPCTPMHALLLDWLENNGLNKPALVMTSANPPGEPICLGNREALARLDYLADAFLLHNRDILARVDDSVLGIPDIPENIHMDARPFFIRRARGYVPSPAPFPDGPPVLGAGAHLKATFCLTRGSTAFVGQHIGDLETAQCLDFYSQSLAHLENLLETKPAAVAHDAHPDFMSSHFALKLAKKENIPAFALQHHAAHAAAVLAENNIYKPALALCLDGTGLGDDGAIWGGELIKMDLSAPSWQRIGSLRPFPLPGGEMAIKHPWRISFAFEGDSQAGSDREKNILREMLAKNFRVPLTSSCGRLFDAVAAMAGLCFSITYEGQAAMRLMNAAFQWLGQNPGVEPDCSSPPLIIDKAINSGMPLVDSHAIFHSCKKILASTGDIALMAAAFHFMLADSLASLCIDAARKSGLYEIGLGGGVMQNGILAWLLPRKLEKVGLAPLTHKILPPGDGGISYGQAVWARQMLAAKK